MSEQDGLESHAQAGEDLILMEMFANRREGVFVEAGALDGVRLSNTWLLAQKLGWTGLLVEPIPQLAEACRQARPESHVLQAALGRTHGSVRLTIPANNPEFATTLGEEHLSLRFEAQAVTTIDVPMVTLDDALESAGLDSLDLVVLDVEDAEDEVMAGFTPSKFRPSVIMLERDRLRTSVVWRLCRSGYRFDRRVGRNDIWVPTNGVAESAIYLVRLYRVGVGPTLRSLVRSGLQKVGLLRTIRRIRSRRT